MLPNKNSKDIRVRFQHSSFTRKLQQARGYKRPRVKIAGSPWENFLENLGINSWWKKFLFAVFFILAVYLIYAPNFLTIKNIKIAGLKQADAEKVKSDIFSYLKRKSILPQSNLLLLSTPKLQAFLSQNGKILKIAAIKKKYPDSLAIDLTPRLDQYLLESGHGNFLVSGDGLVTAQIDGALSSASSPYGNLTVIKYSGGETVNIGQELQSPELQNIAREAKLKLPGIAKTPIAFFQLDNLSAQEISVFLQTGYKIIFDVKLDIGQTLEQINLLLGQIAPSDQNKLAYIDMRFKNKGFVCFKNTPCAAPLKAASSTPASSLTP